MANLWEIDERIMTACVDSETGEIIDEALLAELEIERDTKIENIAKWIRNLDADAEALKAQKQIFENRQKAAENKRDSLKRYLSSYLDGQKWSAKDQSVSIAFRKSEQVSIDNLSALMEAGDQYLRYKEPEVDKKAVKDAIKNGMKVPGCSLVENQSISIK